jgi:hypothetical protein
VVSKKQSVIGSYSIPASSLKFHASDLSKLT